MAGTTRVDIRQLRQFQRNLDRLASTDIEKLCTDAIKELAREFLAKVMQVTPVAKSTATHTGGNLRRGWTTNDIRVQKVGDNYQVEIINPVEYASYVNSGHRTVNGGFVNGRFFMEIAASQVERRTPAILNKHVTRALRGAINGN